MVIDGWSEEEIGFHAWLMVNAGLADGVEIKSRARAGGFAVLTRITWDGYDFLEAARNDTVWSKAKGIIAKAGGAGLDVLKGVLVQLTKDAVTKHMQA